MDQDGWIAGFETSRFGIDAYGRDPQSAMAALAATWREFAEKERLDPAMLAQERDSIQLRGFAFGRGYAKGMGDSLWHDRIMIGDDPVFDHVFADRAPAPR